MKTFLPLTGLLALTLLSCGKTAPQQPGKPVDFTVSILGGPQTRATATTYADESRVNNLQVFVFDESGALEDYRDAGAAMTATLSATSGQRTVWALVNAPALPGITSLDALKAATTSLSDNAGNSLVMSGSTQQEIVDGGSVPVTVRRIVSRVSVGKITTDFKHALADAELQIDAIYLINVAGSNSYDVTAAEPALWVNQLGHYDAAYDPLLSDSLTGVTVSNGHPYEQEHAFYPYPNPVETPSWDDAWCPRHSMLVVEVTFEGATGYYPVELPVLERNKTYHIEELRLTRRPGTLPYKPIETGEATAQITVREWEIGLNLGIITI